MAALPAAAQGLLPPVFGDWAIGQTANNQTATLEQSAGADAPILQEYGYESIEHRDYFRAGQTVGVTLFRMVDPSSAYGAFTYLRPAGMPASNLTHFSAATPERALIVVGNFVLDIRGERLNQPATSLDALGHRLHRRRVPGRHDDRRPGVRERLRRDGSDPFACSCYQGHPALHRPIDHGFPRPPSF
jgi:hypothetical protein